MSARPRRPTKAHLTTVARHQALLARGAAGGPTIRPLGDGTPGPVVHRVWCLRPGVATWIEDRGHPPCSAQVLAGSVCVRWGSVRLHGWPGDLLFPGDAAEFVASPEGAVLLVTSLP